MTCEVPRCLLKFSAWKLKGVYRSSLAGLWLFVALILCFHLNPYEKRSIAASDYSHSIDQLILRQAVTNYLWSQTFPSWLDDSSAKPLSELHHTLDTVLFRYCTIYSLHLLKPLTLLCSSVGAGVSGGKMLV